RTSMQFLVSRRAGVPDRRLWIWFTILSGVLVWLTAFGTERVGAQEPAEKAEAKDAPPAAKEENPPPAVADAGQTPPAGSPAPSGTAQRAPDSLLTLAMRSSGPIGAFLLLLSIYFTALVIRLFMELRVSEAVPVTLVDRLEAAIRDKKFQDA